VSDAPGIVETRPAGAINASPVLVFCSSARRLDLSLCGSNGFGKLG